MSNINNLNNEVGKGATYLLRPTNIHNKNTLRHEAHPRVHNGIYNPEKHKQHRQAQSIPSPPSLPFHQYLKDFFSKQGQMRS